MRVIILCIVALSVFNILLLYINLRIRWVLKIENGGYRFVILKLRDNTIIRGFIRNFDYNSLQNRTSGIIRVVTSNSSVVCSLDDFVYIRSVENILKVVFYTAYGKYNDINFS